MIHFVYDIISSSILFISMFGISNSLSQKTIFAPRRTNAFTEETNVYEGAMISSPVFVFINIAAISRASVHEVVSNTFLNPNLFSKKSWHLFVKRPSPEIFLVSTDSKIYFVSLPVKYGLLNPMWCLVKSFWY